MGPGEPDRVNGQREQGRVFENQVRGDPGFGQTNFMAIVCFIFSFFSFVETLATKKFGWGEELTETKYTSEREGEREREKEREGERQ